jgi:hypothetical protein
LDYGVIELLGGGRKEWRSTSTKYFLKIKRDGNVFKDGTNDELIGHKVGYGCDQMNRTVYVLITY